MAPAKVPKPEQETELKQLFKEAHVQLIGEYQSILTEWTQWKERRDAALAAGLAEPVQPKRQPGPAPWIFQRGKEPFCVLMDIWPSDPTTSNANS